MRKAILVVGGAGYIGSIVVHTLRQANWPVVVLDNLSTGFQKSIKDTPFVFGDARDIATLKSTFESHSFSCVMHLAAKTSVPESFAHPLDYYDNNTLTTINLLKCCEQYHINQFIFSSTAAVYGDTPSKPIDEQFPTNPISPYGQSKLMAEKIIRGYAQQSKCRYINLRYFNVIGAWNEEGLGPLNQSDNLIFNALNTLQGKQQYFSLYGDSFNTLDGSCIRDFIHVRDIANAHLCALEHLNQNGKSHTLNCGYGNGISVKEVLANLEAIAQKRIPTRILPQRQGDCPTVIASNQSILSNLSWRPMFNDCNKYLRSAFLWRPQ